MIKIILVLISVIATTVLCVKKQVYDESTPFLSQILYRKIPSSFDSNQFSLEAVNDPLNSNQETLYRKVYLRHKQPNAIAFSNLYHSFGDVVETTQAPSGPELESREHMDFMFWEISANPTPDAIYRLMRKDHYFVDRFIHSKDQKIMSMMMETIDHAYHEDPFFTAMLITDDKIKADEWAKIIHRADPSRNYEESLHEIGIAKSREFALSLISHFKNQEYNQAYKFMEDPRLSMFIPRNAFKSIVPELVKWISQSPFAHQILLQDRFVYEVFSLPEWVALIGGAFRGRNYPVLKAIYEHKTLANNIPNEILVDPIIQKFIESPQDKMNLKLLDLLTLDHFFPRVAADNWISVALIFTYNNLDYPVGHKIVEKVLTTKELMKAGTPGVVKFFFVSIIRTPEIAKRYIDMLVDEHTAPLLEVDDWKVIIQVLSAFEDEESIEKIRNSEAIRKFMSEEDIDHAIDLNQIATNLVYLGLPENIAEFGATFGSGMKKHFNRMSKTIDALHEKLDVKKFISSKGRSKQNIENAMVTKPFVKAMTPIRRPTTIQKSFIGSQRMNRLAYARF